MLARSLALLLVSFAFLSQLPETVAQSSRPSAMRLFPAETVLWVRTPDAELLVDRFQQTSTAQLIRDPEMASLTESVWGRATSYYDAAVKDLIETDLEDLLRLPAGEIAFGVVKRENATPAVMLIADFGDRIQSARQLVDRLENLAVELGGAMVQSEQLRSDEAIVIRNGNDQSRSVAIVQRDSAFIACSDPVLLQVTLDRWDGIPIDEEGIAELLSTYNADPATDEAPNALPTSASPYLDTLAKNPSFSATLRELAPGGEEPPQLLFYADPIGMIEAFGGRETGVRIAMATFPALGLDGIKGLGGALWLSTDTWDSLARGHLLLSNPRSGVVKVARFETGDTAPPKLVPADVENFIAARVDPTRLYDDIASLYDRFQYEDAFRGLVEKQVSEPMGIDFEKEFVGNLDGSACYFTTYDETLQAFGAQTALCLGVLDSEAAQTSLDKIFEKYPDLFEAADFGKTSYHRIVPRRMRSIPSEERPFSPCLAIIDNSLIFCQHENILQRMIETNDGTRPSLADSLQFRLVRSRLERLTEGRPFSVMGYQDLAPTIRHYYAQATSDESREALNQMAEFSGFLGGVRDVLDEVDMPPLETFLKYVKPSGSVLIDTDTGWHMMSFSFKRSKD